MSVNDIVEVQVIAVLGMSVAGASVASVSVAASVGVLTTMPALSITLTSTKLSSSNAIAPP
jgi:hypothetical protein